MNNINTIKDFISEIAKKLNIDSIKIFDIIQQKKININILLDESIKDEINKLLKIDDDINNFDETTLKNDMVKENFKLLKKNLAELQVRVILKKLEKVENCGDVISVLLSTINKKLKISNEISSLNQRGGAHNVQYYNKYLKYKIKYLLLQDKL
jgi:hypothetical protein